MPIFFVSLSTERLQQGLPGVFSLLGWTTLLDLLHGIAVPALWQFSFRSLGKQTFQLFLKHHSLITQEAPQQTSSLLWKPTNYHRNQRQNVFLSITSNLAFPLPVQHSTHTESGGKKRKKKRKKAEEKKIGKNPTLCTSQNKQNPNKQKTIIKNPTMKNWKNNQTKKHQKKAKEKNIRESWVVDGRLTSAINKVMQRQAALHSF